MIKDKIYTHNEIQSVWLQFAKDPRSILWSDNDGLTWNEVPSMDTGKWSRFSIVDGKRVYWVYKLA